MSDDRLSTTSGPEVIDWAKYLRLGFALAAMGGFARCPFCLEIHDPIEVCDD